MGSLALDSPAGNDERRSTISLWLAVAALAWHDCITPTCKTCLPIEDYDTRGRGWLIGSIASSPGGARRRGKGTGSGSAAPVLNCDICGIAHFMAAASDTRGVREGLSRHFKPTQV